MSRRKKNRTRIIRLCKSREIKGLFRKSRKITWNGFALIYKENGLDCNRIVVIAKKGFTRAVDRNKQRRRVKEIYRYFDAALMKGYDIGIIIPPGRFCYKDVYEIVRQLFFDASLIL
ncbi:MAG: ribonuclease P protein component [Spirochaetales bacterium]|nr:ribonuclease P protein component [Spirochaetales bacterium]